MSADNNNGNSNGTQRTSPFAAGQAGRDALGLDGQATPESAADGPSQSAVAAKAGSKTVQLLGQLRLITLPGMSQDIVSASLVKNLVIQDGLVKFNVALSEPSNDIEDFVEGEVADKLGGLEWIQECELGFLVGPGGPEIASLGDADSAGVKPAGRSAQVSSSALNQAEQQSARFDALHGPQAQGSLPLVKHVIAVGSGKGGVGKSTVAVNLALALLQNGFKVGLLDADVYGPSVPLMLGISERPYVNDNEKLVPPELYGLKVMSIGLLLAEDQAVVWRGPMIHGVMRQFLGDVEWGELDYLIIDLPPGTGDAPLSISQSLPLTAAVVVTTPQEVAASVAQKSIAMFERIGIKTMGIIENMSYFICPSCEEQHDIFGRGGAAKIAAHYQVPLLGELPLDTRMRQGGDTGHPLLLQHPRSELAEQFRKIAARLAEASRSMDAQRAGSPEA